MKLASSLFRGLLPLLALACLAGAASADELRAHCRTLLLPHKVPRVLTIRDALPRSPLGKVLIGRLLAEA